MPTQATPTPSEPSKYTAVPSPSQDLLSYIRVQVSLTLSSKANITNEQLQTDAVRSALTQDLAVAIGIDSSLVTITDVYICPGSPKCQSRIRQLDNGLDTGKKIIIEFEVKASEEIVSAAESNLVSDSFQDKLGEEASASLSQTLNQNVKVTVDSPPVTLERMRGTSNDGDDDSYDRLPDDDPLPDWVIPAVASAGGLLAVVIIGLFMSRKRAESKLARQIRSMNDSLSRQSEKNESKRKPFSSKNDRGRDSSVPSTQKGLKKTSPYAFQSPEKKPGTTPSPRSPYQVQEVSKDIESPGFVSKVEEKPKPIFNPAPSPPIAKASTPPNRQESEQMEQIPKRRPLPPLRRKSDGGLISQPPLPPIGPGTPVALPSPSAVNRYRAYQAEKKARQEKRRLALQKQTDASPKSDLPSEERGGRISPKNLSPKEKQKLLEEYKSSHKQMFASVKERLKKEHLERLQKPAQLKAEAEGAVEPTKTDTPKKSLQSKSNTTTGAKSNANHKEADEAKSKILEASSSSVSRADVLKSYKEDHKRMREQMKAKLKAEYMARLRRERDAKKMKVGESRINGEGKSGNDSTGPSNAKIMGALGLGTKD